MHPDRWMKAAGQFSKFLQDCGCPDRLLWVRPIDVLAYGGQMWVRARKTEAAIDDARELYVAAVKGGLGVWLYSFAVAEEKSIAVVLAPTTEDERQRNMLARHALKLSATTCRPSARLVTNQLRWLILSLRYGASSESFRRSYLECS
jgi:hypothetical protein